MRVADKTKIEWTDATWNVINGCSVVSPGCTHCYAMRLAGTRMKHHASREGLTVDTATGPVWSGKVSFYKPIALQPMKWGRPRRIFVCAHGDLFHDEVPDDWIDFVFNMAFLAPQHTFQILTKRPARMRQYMQMVLDEPEKDMAYRFGISMLHAGLENTPKDKLPEIHWPPRNVWLGTSVEDQVRADERVPLLLDTPAAVRWLSMEPLLGPVDLRQWLFPKGPRVDWVVLGGESGFRSRPMHPDWAREVRDQCRMLGVPFLFKQWGDWMEFDAENVERMAPNQCIEERLRVVFQDPVRREGRQQHMVNIGKQKAGRKLDGVFHDGYPQEQSQ